MDEMQKIRDLMPEQPAPSANVVVQARARLAELSESAVPAPQRPRRRLVIAGIATVAAAAAAVGVVTVPQWGAEQPTPNVVAGDHGTAPTAREVLQVAARKADQDAAGSGRFWRVRTVSITPAVNQLVGTAPNTYRLETRWVTESWASLDGKEPDWSGQRKAGIRPASPADEAAWKRDGSPTTWNLGPNTELNGRDHVLSAAPDEGLLRKRDVQEQVVPGFTAKQLRDLPADPVALRELVTEAIKSQDIGPEDWAAHKDSLLFNRTVALLSDAPVSPQVSAAALRLLADLGGVSSSGLVTDALGRKGTGITLVTPGAVTETRQLVIDPASGRLLGSDYTGAQGKQVVKQSRSVVLSAEWTDQAPAVPSAEIS
jgi:hypothetical protein